MPGNEGWEYNGKPWYQSSAVLGVTVLGLAEGSFLFIQFSEMIRSKNVGGVSVIAFTLYLMATIGWLVWGSLSHDAAVLITSAFSLLGAILVMGAIYWYNGEPANPKHFSALDPRSPFNRTEPAAAKSI